MSDLQATRSFDRDRRTSGPGEGPRIAVVIPCYNTSGSCAPVIAAARAVADAVIVIDDGSTDDTFQYIAASGCEWLRFPQNQGKGVALRAGMAEVVEGSAGRLGQDFDYLITLDGDGQHEPSAYRA